MEKVNTKSIRALFIKANSGSTKNMAWGWKFMMLENIMKAFGKKDISMEKAFCNSVMAVISEAIFKITISMDLLNITGQARRDTKGIGYSISWKAMALCSGRTAEDTKETMLMTKCKEMVSTLLRMGKNSQGIGSTTKRMAKVNTLMKMGV